MVVVLVCYGSSFGNFQWVVNTQVMKAIIAYYDSRFVFSSIIIPLLSNRVVP